MTKAVFIGGAFDMTKREVKGRYPDVTFFEPLDHYVASKIGEENVMCRQIKYRLAYEMRDGTLIYEVERVA